MNQCCKYKSNSRKRMFRFVVKSEWKSYTNDKTFEELLNA